MRQAVPEILALKVLKYFPKIRVRQNRGTFAAVFLGQAVINPFATGGQLCTDPVRSGPGRAGSCRVPALTLKLRNLHFISLACSVVILIQFLGL